MLENLDSNTTLGHKHTHTPRDVNTHTQTRAHTPRTYIYAYTCILTCTHTHTHTHTHTQNTCTHTHTHTHRKNPLRPPASRPIRVSFMLHTHSKHMHTHPHTYTHRIKSFAAACFQADQNFFQVIHLVCRKWRQRTGKWGKLGIKGLAYIYMYISI